MRRGFESDWAPYVPVAERRRQAAAEASRHAQRGKALRPVRPRGRQIATSFWGKAWCDNLESYSDYANRLPRGRSYLRSGSVIDLEIQPGKVRALVSGSQLYRIEVEVDALDPPQWQAIVTECTGKIGSLVEVLQGRLSKGVMEVVTRPGKGLFPKPRQMRLSCSCPDWASMCKHVAATLYGVGARLDEEPELLFTLRHVQAAELVERAVSTPVAAAPHAAGALAGADLSALFGIEIAGDPPAHEAPEKLPAKAAVKSAAKKPQRQPRRPKTITAAELLARGVPRHMIQSWLAAGVLGRGPQRGVYTTSAQTEARIRTYLDRAGCR